MEGHDYPTVTVDGQPAGMASASIPVLLEALGACWMPQRRRRDRGAAPALHLLVWACPPLGKYAGRLLGETP